MPARTFAPDGDLCNCESILHGHGYPCRGVARAGENKLWGVGEVCLPCYLRTPAEFRNPAPEAACADREEAAPGVRRRRRR
jgi:hypothetical protein